MFSGGRFQQIPTIRKSLFQRIFHRLTICKSLKAELNPDKSNTILNSAMQVN